jgi:hypothetical protein
MQFFYNNLNMHGILDMMSALRMVGYDYVVSIE